MGEGEGETSQSQDVPPVSYLAQDNGKKARGEMRTVSGSRDSYRRSVSSPMVAALSLRLQMKPTTGFTAVLSWYTGADPD